MNKTGLEQVVLEMQTFPKALVPVLRKIKRLFRPGDQSEKRYEIAIVLLLSDAAQNYARRIQLNLLKKYHIKHGISARPHVTLKLGFQTFNIDLLEEYFDQLVFETKPVEIVINRFGFFDEGIVFLDVEKSAPLENMRQRIISDLKSKFSILPHAIEGDAYRFHATVAHGLSKRDFDQARETFQNERVDFRFTATTCALFFCIDGQWITYKQATLLKRNETEPAEHPGPSEQRAPARASELTRRIGDRNLPGL